MNSNERPLISVLKPMKDFDTVIIYKEKEPIASRIEKTKYMAPLFYDPASIVKQVYDSSTGKSIVMVTDKKVSDFKAITQRLINMLKDGFHRGIINELHYYNIIAGYLATSRLNKPADKNILKTFAKFGDIQCDKQGYFKCVLVNDIWKHGEIHIDIAGNFYWYDIVNDQYYCDKCGLFEYPSLTIPITELNKRYMDVVKMKKPARELDENYLSMLFLEYAKSICKLENDNYEGGIML